MSNFQPEFKEIIDRRMMDFMKDVGFIGLKYDAIDCIVLELFNWIKKQKGREAEDNLKLMCFFCYHGVIGVMKDFTKFVSDFLEVQDAPKNK